jgi:hypothetical protein
VKLSRACWHFALNYFSELIHLAAQQPAATIKAQVLHRSQERLKKLGHAPLSAANTYRERWTWILDDAERSIASRHDRAA